ncbi:MAG: DUF4332 domain-containing protein [Spiribacter sp.]|jgi:large subunit ribosomal protein L21|nr:DUF4332 domain-containing protein [Spiribacter sp.]MDR9455084.1 DUF4332 domain-containing protein [Spiribacter sp.]
MWNDLMRRWMDMALWWLPSNRNNGETANPSAPASRPEAPAQPKASPSPTPQPSATDLTGIKGIGPAMQKRLEKLGVTSPAQLAAADADRLTEQLKAGGAVVSRNRVVEWIQAAGQA